MPIHAKNLHRVSKYRRSDVDAPNMNADMQPLHVRWSRSEPRAFPWRCILTQTKQTNTQKLRCFSHYQGRRTAPNKGFSKRGVSRASEVLALATLVTRSAEREGGERQKILYAYGSNLYKSVFVTKTWLGFLLNSYFYILEHQRGQLTYECTAFG